MGKQAYSVVCLAHKEEELPTLQHRAGRNKYICNNVCTRYSRTLNNCNWWCYQRCYKLGIVGGLCWISGSVIFPIILQRKCPPAGNLVTSTVFGGLHCHWSLRRSARKAPGRLLKTSELVGMLCKYFIEGGSCS